MKISSEKSDLANECLCGSGLPYRLCCGVLHSGAGQALSAEQLMRSRFSAYARKDARYLSETWDKSTCPPIIDLSTEPVEWTRLEIVNLKKGMPNDRKGIVEFNAYYLSNGQEHVMREISRFRKVDNRWLYLDGTVKSIGQAGEHNSRGRNALCTCGSGKKAKRCCGKA